MTRQYFLNNVYFWEDLLDFCNEEGCYVADSILSKEDMDERVDDDLEEAVLNYGWKDILEMLQYIPDHGEYFKCDGVLDYSELDDEDFDIYKSDVLDWMDEYGEWDEDVEDMENTDTEMNEESLFDDNDLVENEDISIFDLITACSYELDEIKKNDIIKREEDRSCINTYIFSS